MKIKVGVMGSASAADDDLLVKADGLARAIAAQNVILLTGATTGVVYAVGRGAHEKGAFHVGISPAGNLEEHTDKYKLPTDACDALIYTGFGLKGRNVVLVRSCDVVLFIAGAMGSLNEFTIAHDEAKVIGCLTNTGGVADEVEYLLEKFSKPTGAQVFLNSEPEQLLAACLDSVHEP
ncbi:MAG TPA: hypothetical protein VGN86_02375 [Pyrinomonadaceae bacterium]|jgi:hypothetical protein|nr:hypothetical protein [Pyrinomonadaceae bacterium]